MADDIKKTFVEHFLRDQHRIYGYIVTLAPSRSDAEEIFQETSLLLWEKWQEFDASRDLLPWACGIAHNVLRNYLRKKRPQSVILDEPYMERIAQTRLAMEDELAPRRAALSVCLERLPASQRSLVEQCYQNDASMKQVAEETGMTSNALYLKLRRVRQLLMECIERRLRDESV